MIGSLIAFCLRQVVALAFGTAVVIGLSLLILTTPQSYLAWLPAILRCGLATTLMVTVLIEGALVERQIDLRERILAREGHPGLTRIEKWFQGSPATGAVLSVLFLGYISRQVWTRGAGTSLFEVLFVLFATPMVLWLLFAGLSRLRFWYATRRMQGARKVPGAFPLLAGAECVFLLGLVVFRLPHLSVFKTLLVATASALHAPLGIEGDGRVELLVQLGPDDRPEEIAGILRDNASTMQPAVPHATRDESLLASHTLLVSTPLVLLPFVVHDLAEDEENVADIELNAVVHPIRDTSKNPCRNSTEMGPSRDPLSAGQTALRAAGIDRVLQRSAYSYRTSPPVRLAVIDTGIDDHEDLRGVVLGPTGVDRKQHGTAVAGIAAAIGNNGIGMASVNDRGRFLRVLDYPALAGQLPSADDVADALFKAVDDDASVVLMAFSSDGPVPSIMKEAVRHARDAGLVLVAAAGNEGGGAGRRWPANIDGVVVVTALDGDRLATFSTHGGPDAIGAPGVAVCAPTPGGGYQEQDGSSMAAALVAGAVGRRRAECPRESGRSTEAALQATSRGLYDVGPRRLRVDALLEWPCSSR